MEGVIVLFPFSFSVKSGQGDYPTIFWGGSYERNEMLNETLPFGSIYPDV